MSPGDIINGHPHLKVEDVRAAQEFATDYLGQEETIFATVEQ